MQPLSRKPAPQPPRPERMAASPFCACVRSVRGGRGGRGGALPAWTPYGAGLGGAAPVTTPPRGHLPASGLASACGSGSEGRTRGAGPSQGCERCRPASRGGPAALRLPEAADPARPRPSSPPSTGPRGGAAREQHSEAKAPRVSASDFSEDEFRSKRGSSHESGEGRVNDAVGSRQSARREAASSCFPSRRE
ncbi:serine/arginine repetitive matrix protein 3-like [Heterocephalus glaber]|uniref:Serine/arginine repetitive matrix protein 3-like n=1 Tax=Heterocephalus glaber TaxID=10181 RepID=A0AAX6SMC5_HETGA|nr:serine/arginine repetitive matrix protein 3-like [Heterocephalus glaber]